MRTNEMLYRYGEQDLPAQVNMWKSAKFKGDSQNARFIQASIRTPLGINTVCLKGTIHESTDEWIVHIPLMPKLHQTDSHIDTVLSSDHRNLASVLAAVNAQDIIYTTQSNTASSIHDYAFDHTLADQVARKLNTSQPEIMAGISPTTSEQRSTKRQDDKMLFIMIPKNPAIHNEEESIIEALRRFQAAQIHGEHVGTPQLYIAPLDHTIAEAEIEEIRSKNIKITRPH